MFSGIRTLKKTLLLLAFFCIFFDGLARGALYRPPSKTTPREALELEFRYSALQSSGYYDAEGNEVAFTNDEIIRMIAC